MIRGIRKVAALAHQLAAQVRVRRKAVAAVQPEQVVNEQKFAHRHRYGKDVFAGLQRVGEAAQPGAFLEIFRLDELVDIAHYRAAQRIDVEHRVENILADVFARRRGPTHWAASQRVAEKFVEMLPVVEMQQQGIAALHVLLVDLHH